MNAELSVILQYTVIESIPRIGKLDLINVISGHEKKKIRCFCSRAKIHLFMTMCERGTPSCFWGCYSKFFGI